MGKDGRKISFEKFMFRTYQLYPIAQTGKPHPNISTIFIGKSSPEEDVWRLTPKSALAVNTSNQLVCGQDGITLNTDRWVLDSLPGRAKEYIFLRVANAWSEWD